MSSSSFGYALLAGVMPSLIWLAFWLREDSDHDEPRWLLALSFLGGALAVIAAVFVEKYISDIVNDTTWCYTLWAAAEELLKLLVVVLIVLNTKYNDEPIKPMVYCITVALGFAALENAFFLMTPLSQGDIAQSIITGNMRFIGATLVHIVCSATIGFAIGLSYYRSLSVKFVSITVGIITAIALHTAFNLSIINSSSADTLKTFGWIWLAVIILIVLFEEVKVIHPKYS